MIKWSNCEKFLKVPKASLAFSGLNDFHVVHFFFCLFVSSKQTDFHDLSIIFCTAASLVLSCYSGIIFSAGFPELMEDKFGTFKQCRNIGAVFSKEPHPSIITWTGTGHQPPIKQWPPPAWAAGTMTGRDQTWYCWPSTHTPGPSRKPPSLSLWRALARGCLVLFPAEWRVQRGCVDQTSDGYNVSGIMQCSEQVRWVGL